MKIYPLSLIMFLFSLSPVFAAGPVQVLQGIVTKVSDGDTITVNTEKARVKVRLYGIDAPELTKIVKKTGRVGKPGQPYGDESRLALQERIHGRPVTLEVINVDRYKRVVAIVRQGTGNVNREMVGRGYAWAYREYLQRPHASEYLDAEERARRAGLGLWRQGNPTPPWEFRKLMRKKQKHPKRMVATVGSDTIK